MTRISLLATITITVCTLGAEAQIQISRSFEINPLSEEIDKETRLFGAATFGAEVGHGSFSAEEELTWNVKYQGFLEFFRWGNRGVLGLQLGHELRVNPYNEIYFNPRGAIWNESLIYHHKLRKGILHLGLNHRCRHDIDNADPPRDDISRTGYDPTGRVLVLTSVSGGYLSEGKQISQFTEFKYFLRADAYLYTEDSRLPRDNQDGSWENMLGSTVGGLVLDHQLSETWSVHSRSHINYVFFRDHQNQINYRTEFGLSATGEKARVSLFLAYERFFDDVSRPFPQPSEVFFIGLRGAASDFF